MGIWVESIDDKGTQVYRIRQPCISQTGTCEIWRENNNGMKALARLRGTHHFFRTLVSVSYSHRSMLLPLKNVRIFPALQPIPAVRLEFCRRMLAEETIVLSILWGIWTERTS